MPQIVCFGDSNTWGLWPKGLGRYNKDTRWPGIIRNYFADKYVIVEEGLNGRTANERDEDEPYLNGKDYAAACLLSHRPIKYIVLMLGNNDVKERYNKTAKEVADSIADLAKYMDEIMKQHQPERYTLILISPKGLDKRVLGDGTFTEYSIEKSHQIGGLLKKHAEENGWEFLDMDIPEVIVSEDGLHLTKEGHRVIAEKVIKLIS